MHEAFAPAIFFSVCAICLTICILDARRRRDRNKH
jgi:hypothetical protein